MGAGPERNRRSGIYDVGRKTARGRFFIGEPVAMRRPAQVPLDRTRFPLTLAGGLRNAFADVVSTPLPARLAALMRRLRADHDERSGEEPTHGASAPETSSARLRARSSRIGPASTTATNAKANSLSRSARCSSGRRFL